MEILDYKLIIILYIEYVQAHFSSAVTVTCIM